MESSLPPTARILWTILISLNVYFMYRALLSSLEHKPTQPLDIGFLILFIITVSVIAVTGSYLYRSLAYSFLVIFFMIRATIQTLRKLGRLPMFDLAPMLFFLGVYILLFVYRGISLIRGEWSPEYFLTAPLGSVTTLILTILHLLSNFGVHIVGSINAEEEIMASRDEAVQERDFANDLVKIIGHDLSGFLAGIQNANELVSDRTDPMISTISSNATRAQTMLIDLVYWGRSRSGQDDGSRDIVPTNTLVDMVLHDVGLMTERKGVSFHKEISSAFLSVDQTAARVVLRNLVSNAVKFSAAGGEIGIMVSLQEDEACVCISDKGPGMESDLVRKIRKGQHLPSSEGTAGEAGTGTGMRIVTAICRTSGWRLDILSTAGRGTAISVYFPLADTSLKS